MLNKIGKNKGFTLLELMLSIGLTIILISGAMQVTKQLTDVWRKTNKVTDSTEEIILTTHFLRNTISQAKPINWKKSETNKVRYRAFVGNNSDMKFITKLPVQTKSNIFLVSVFKDNDVIKIGYQDFNLKSAEETLGNKLTSEILITNITKFEIFYYGKENNSSELYQWNNNWIDRKNLPLAVKLSITRVLEKQQIESIVIIKLNYANLD